MTQEAAPATPSVVVTGATGNVGRHVTQGLLNAGVPVRVAARDPASAQRAFPAAEVVRFVYGEEASYGPAFAGARGLFLVRPPEISDVKARIVPAIEAARAAGVRQVVFLSLQGADRNPVVPHRRIEDHLREHGPDWTFLRPSFFMQNLTTTHRQDIAEHDEVFVPAGRGRTSFVDARDVAEVAVKVLSEHGHARRGYEITGKEALSYAQVAEILSEVLGREIRYANPTPLRFWRRMRARGIARPHVMVMVALYAACRFGIAARVTNETHRLLGRPPRTFRAFAEDHRDAWAKPAPHPFPTL